MRVRRRGNRVVTEEIIRAALAEGGVAYGSTASVVRNRAWGRHSLAPPASGFAPLRRRLGFEIAAAWTVPAEHRFIWVLRHPDGWPAFQEADERYFASPERKAFDPDPARLIEEQRNTPLTDIGVER